LVLVVCCWGSAEVSVFEPVGVPAEGDDLGVVDKPVDHGGGDHVVTEDFTPTAERLVGGAAISEARSYRLETSWKNRFAASGSKGM
jgi:hypothetical protein